MICDETLFTILNYSEMQSRVSMGDLQSGNLETETVIEHDYGSDLSDDVKYLKLELNQLRRQNKHLRRRLEKYRAKIQNEKDGKVKKQYAILKPEDPFVEVIRELHASRQIFEAFGGNNRSPNFKMPTIDTVPQPYNCDVLASKLEALSEKEDSHKITALIDILEQQHTQRQQYTRDIEDFLEQVVDVIRRITKAFTTRALKLRKQYNKLKSRVILTRLQHEKYRMDINLLLRDFAGHLYRKGQDPFSADSDPINLSQPRPSFKMEHPRKSSTLKVQNIQRQSERKSKSPLSPKID